MRAGTKYFMQASLAMVFILGVADYRYWQSFVEDHEIPRRALEQMLLKEMRAEVQLPLQVQSLEVIEGSEEGMLGLSLQATLFGGEPRNAIFDARAYEVPGRIIFLHLCLRPSGEPAAPATAWSIYEEVLHKELRYDRYEVAIPDTPTWPGYAAGRPISHIILEDDAVTLRTGMAATVDELQKLAVGEAWPACP